MKGSILLFILLQSQHILQWFAAIQTHRYYEVQLMSQVPGGDQVRSLWGPVHFFHRWIMLKLLCYKNDW